jgi:tRNA(Glu) U13 pseudouridine synthase TruD
MFIHVVLIEVKPKEVAKYRKDSLMWASYTKRAKGFIAYSTMKRFGYKDQYSSVYEWDKKTSHDRFMGKYHDWLVGKSKAKVKVLGYYNLKELDNLAKI